MRGRYLQAQIENQNGNFGQPDGGILTILQQQNQFASIDAVLSIWFGQGRHVETGGKEIAIAPRDKIDGDDEGGVKAQGHGDSDIIGLIFPIAGNASWDAGGIVSMSKVKVRCT